MSQTGFLSGMNVSIRSPIRDHRFCRQMLSRCLLWTLAIALLMGIGNYFSRREIRGIALGRARDSFQKDVTTRLWATQRGGVYVPLNEKTPANPYLKDIPDREIKTTDGKVYTLVNPAYMTRMLHELGKSEYGLQGHITSLNPIRPGNAADPWEQKALKTFASGSNEYWEEVSLGDRPYLRFMGSLITVPGCLGCHASQGYKVGDVRGGISVTVPMAQSGTMVGSIQDLTTLLSLGLLWVAGLGAILWMGLGNQRRINEREQSERVLEASRKEQDNLFALVPDLVCIASTDGHFKKLNSAWERTLGFTIPELLEAPIESFIHPDDVESTKHEIGRQIAGRLTINFTNRYRTRTGEYRLLEWNATPAVEGHALFAIARDITERNRIEEERQRLQSQLHQAHKMESLGVLSAGVAHNINNILAIILGTASLREMVTTEPPDREAYQRIGNACIRGRNIVKSMLHFAQPTLSAKAPVELHMIIQEVRVLLENTTINAINIFESFAGEPLWINGDAGGINHAILNLCLNSLGAMPHGGTLTLRTAILEENLVEVSVEDNGAGMTPEVLAHVLEPFYTTKEVGKGTGLGLSMTYGVVKSHGGTIDITSQPGQGTTVRLRFPRLPGPVQREASKAPAPSMGSMNVFLVDDDKDVRFLMARMLKQAGVRQVKTFSSGEEVLESLRSDELPDLVILDQNMPGMTGIQVMARVRGLYPDLPILFSSGQPDIESLESLKQPWVAVISKPFNMNEIQAKLAEFVHESSQGK